MLAIKGHYRDGKITLLEPMPEGLREADLNIIVLPRKEGQYSPLSSEALFAKEESPEVQYQALGLKSFFENGDDAQVDWEDCLGLK